MRAAALRFVAAWMGFLCIASHVQAQEVPFEVEVAGKMVTLSLPEKTCAYERKEKVDAKILDAMEKSDPRNQLLLAFIDCNNLQAIRGVKGVSMEPGYYGQILSSISGQGVADTYLREAYVKAITAQYAGKESPDQAMARGEQMLQALVNGKADDTGAQTIGVIKTDKDFVQIGMIGSMQTPTGVVEKVINVITLTKLGVPVSIYLAHPATDMTLRALSERSEIYARKLISLNSEGISLFANGVDPGSLLLGLAIGVFLSIFVAAIFRKFK